VQVHNLPFRREIGEELVIGCYCPDLKGRIKLSIGSWKKGDTDAESDEKCKQIRQVK